MHRPSHRASQYQMVSGYLRFLAPNSTGLGAIVRSGPPANLTDFAIACDQYFVYFTDDVRLWTCLRMQKQCRSNQPLAQLMVPSTNPAQLRTFGQAIPSGRASLTDLSTGQPAVVPSLTSSSSNSTRGRRLVAGLDVAVPVEALDFDEF